MGPSARGTPTLAPASPRPGAGGGPGARPTSELLGTGAMSFQTPEAEALDQWFENLQNYEATLEEMAAASLDANFKEELSAIEQWFKVLSEAERTAALYSLLQHSTQVQIRFFITVLQQMARSDPMTALLSPAMGSMQSQMESRIAGMKSPGLKSGLPASPTTRNFNTNRQSLALDHPPSNYLSPDSAVNQGGVGGGSGVGGVGVGGRDEAAAATLASRRAELKANASHRVSAPNFPSAASGGDGRISWGPSQLSQVNESQSSSLDDSRPKSTEFSGSLGTPKLTTDSDSNSSDSWASMVTTPLVPMFNKKDTTPANPTVAPKNDWHSSAAPGVPRMGDPTIHRRKPQNVNNNSNNNNNSGVVYDDNGNPVSSQQGGPQRRGWGARSPALGSVPSNDGSNNNSGSNNNTPNPNNSMNGLGVPFPPGAGGPGGMGVGPGAFGMTNLGSPTLGMGMGMGGVPPGMGGMGMNPLSPFNVNMLGMMTPEAAQILAAQIAAGGGAPGGAYMNNPQFFGMHPLSAGLGSAGLGVGGRGGRMGGSGALTPSSARSVSGGPKSATSSVSRHRGDGDGGSTPKAEEDVNPELLKDIPAWLRSLRLHKYTPNFEGAKWQDMVMMDEAQLEAKGVAALGARRKMLKTFELVRKKMGIEGGPPPETPVSAAPPSTSS